MTNERPIEDARCWFQNTADRTVDIYVNYHESPLTSVKPEEDQPVFSVDSEANGIYGTYTFEAREVGDQNDPPLASASVMLQEGDSFTGVFHQVGPAEYDFAIYESDFSPSASSRFEIRHTGLPEQIEWELFPKPEADPRIPDDERSGVLSRGQWQQALDVTPNDYRLEIYSDGDLIAFRQDLELEMNRQIVVSLLGDPQPWMGSDEKEDHILRQEYQIQTGPENEDVVTPPAPPYSTTDTNQPVELTCDPVELFHTNRTEKTVEATDPDGIVSSLAVGSVEPYSDGFGIPDESLDRAYAIGGSTTGTLVVQPKVPPADYDVELLANPEGAGERATCTVPITVKEITVARLRELVHQHEQGDEMTDEIASRLYDLLAHAAVHLGEDDPADNCTVSVQHDVQDETAAACAALKQVVTLVGENKSEGISGEAAVDIETETKALRKYLSCG